jgi:hypothetical protein
MAGQNFGKSSTIPERFSGQSFDQVPDRRTGVNPGESVIVLKTPPGLIPS